MPETNKFNNNAVCFIKIEGKLKRDMIAKYPVAPPCPILEYKKDINGIKRKKNISFD